MRRYPIPRPTEAAAIRAAARCPVPAQPPEVLFERLLFARATGDREGVCLLGHLVVRGSREGDTP